MHLKEILTFPNLLNAYRFTHTAFPLWILMIHYTVVNTWIGEKGCDDTNLKLFMGYWSIMLIASGCIAGVDSFFTSYKWSHWVKKWLFSLVYVLLAMAQFTTWSFMRSKPFKCFSDGDTFTYITGPVFFWLVQVLVIIWTGFIFFIKRNTIMSDFVKIPDFSTETTPMVEKDPSNVTF